MGSTGFADSHEVIALLQQVQHETRVVCIGTDRHYCVCVARVCEQRFPEYRRKPFKVLKSVVDRGIHIAFLKFERSE